jgi:hypothetical protein
MTPYLGGEMVRKKMVPGTCEEMCFEKRRVEMKGCTGGQIFCMVTFRCGRLLVIAFSLVDFFIPLPPLASLLSLHFTFLD